GGIEPVTTDTFGSSSLVPCPNELSVLPLGRSKPAFRPATFCQSVVPNVVGLVSRLPSPPANVLPLSAPRQPGVPLFAGEKSHPPGRSALDADTQNTENSTKAVTVAPMYHQRRTRR